MDALAALQLKKKKQKETENLQKQNENELRIVSEIKTLQEQRRLNEMFGFPAEPKQVFCIARGLAAAVWWVFDGDIDSIIGWEVLRYRKDPNPQPFQPPLWQYKGSQLFPYLQKLQVLIDELATSNEYRFSVKAINQKGKSLESSPSNALLIETPLPSGWFRFYDDRVHRPYYASIKSNRSSWKRPETDPFFIEDAIYSNFEEKELKHLKSLYLEDIAHFQTINVERFQDLLSEIGEKASKAFIKKLFLTYSGEMKIKDWKHFMEVINHLKLQHINRETIASCHLFEILFHRNRVKRVLPPDRNKLGNEWEVEFNTFAQRLYYKNLITQECTWDMPDSVKFFIPASLEEKLLSFFDLYEIEELRRSFALLDIDNSGDLSESEIKLLLGSLGMKVNDKKLKKLMKAIDTNQNGTVEFDEFCWMMYEIKRKERSRATTVTTATTAGIIPMEKSSSFQGNNLSSSVFNEINFQGKFSFGSMSNMLSEMAKKRQGKRRDSFTDSSIDDSSTTFGDAPRSQSFPRSLFFCFFKSRRSAKIVSDLNSEDPSSGSLVSDDRSERLRRANSITSMVSFEDTSLLEQEEQQQHKLNVRRKSSFRDLSEEVKETNHHHHHERKKHSKHCYCGCRRY